jgi:hypothetical protein
VDVISQYFAAGATRVEVPGRSRATADTAVTPRYDGTIPDQGFCIHYESAGIVVDHADDAGLAAALDAVELLNEDASFETALEVRDAPVFPTRAYLMDMSGDRILSWDGFVRIVEMLETLRFNQLELRVGHAFAYRDQDVVWEGASPLTPAQLHRIEALCQSHGIRLVLAIEPLTHWERWLSHPEYAWRAELPQGRLSGDGTRRRIPPSELAATPDNAHFVAGLVEQLTATLSGRRINIGGHSTRELGRGRSRRLVERRGLEAVALDFIAHATVALERHGTVGEMWADLVSEDPALLAQVPAQVTPVVRCSGPERFAEAGGVLARSRRSFWVAPGTGSWNTLCGRSRQAVDNVDDAVTWGVASGASGLLLTSWAGRGHWAPEALNLPAMVEAAVRAWRGDGPGEDLGPLLGALVPEDVAAALLRLGDVPEAAPLPPTVRNTDLTWEALRTGGHLPPEWGVGAERVDAARQVVRDVRRILDSGPGGAGPGGTGALPRAQVRLCADLCDFGLTLVDVAQGRSRAAEADLRGRWDLLVARHRELWLATAREGGLEHSLSLLDPLGAAGEAAARAR